MSIATVVHCKRQGYDIYIGRPSKWGNPFKINAVYQGHKMNRLNTIQAYEDWIRYSDEGQKLLLDIPSLYHKVLGCWCKPQPCHGDILVQLLEEMEERIEDEMREERDGYNRKC